MLFKILRVIFRISLIFALSQAQVDEPCTVRHNGARGVCKVDINCPRIQADAQRGIKPTACGTLSSTIQIVCCEGAKVSNIQPNALINVHNEDDGIIFRGYDFDDEPGLSISEKKCLEYHENPLKRVQAIPLLPNVKPSGVVNSQCRYDSMALVVGGRSAQAGEFPFMALLGYVGEERDIEWLCGGTLISDYYVMTAAHCISSRRGRPVVVRLGELDLSTQNEMSRDFHISNIIKHPRYTRRPIRNDIALIKLSKKVIFNNFIRPACLWNKNKDVTSATATGWGWTAYGGRSSDVLQKVSLSILDKSICERTFGALPNTIVCAGDLKGKRDTCDGDSGGPLTIRDEDNQCKHYALGITSFGKGCAWNIPAVYTKVSAFVHWIEGIVWK